MGSQHLGIFIIHVGLQMRFPVVESYLPAAIFEIQKSRRKLAHLEIVMSPSDALYQLKTNQARQTFRLDLDVQPPTGMLKTIILLHLRRDLQVDVQETLMVT